MVVRQGGFLEKAKRLSRLAQVLYLLDTVITLYVMDK